MLHPFAGTIKKRGFHEGKLRSKFPVMIPDYLYPGFCSMTASVMMENAAPRNCFGRYRIAQEIENTAGEQQPREGREYVKPAIAIIEIEP